MSLIVLCVCRSRILMLDGHMYFHAAKSKNISFVTSADSSIYFGAFNLQTLASVVGLRYSGDQTDFVCYNCGLRVVTALGISTCNGALTELFSFCFT